MNMNELSESITEPLKLLPSHPEQQLLQIGLDLYRSQRSDEEITAKLRNLIEQDKLPDGNSLLIAVLYQLGAYNSALALFSPQLLRSKPVQLLYAEVLIRTGAIGQALSYIGECLNNRTQDDAEFIEKMHQLSEVCQLQIQGSLTEDIPFSRLSGLIDQAVKLGLPDLASKLASSGDDYMHGLLIEALYREGYIAAAKQHLSRLPDPLSLGSQSIFQQIAFISAELLHDEECYAEASRIFEILSKQAPEMAHARFGAASCYLHETMNNLFRRIELYHPSEQEKCKIDKYLDKIQQTLLIVHDSNWHTVWSPAQQRNMRHHRSDRLN